MSSRLAAIVLLVSGVYFGTRWLFPDDEALIRGVLEQIASGIENAAAPGSAGALGAVARATELQEEFAPDVIVEAGPPFERLRGRSSVIAAAARVSLGVPDIDVSFPDIAIVVAEDRQTATALVTAEATFTEGGRRVLDARELDVTFARLEGRWVVSAVTLMQPLERLDR